MRWKRRFGLRRSPEKKLPRGTESAQGEGLSAKKAVPTKETTPLKESRKRKNHSLNGLQRGSSSRASPKVDENVAPLEPYETQLAEQAYNLHCLIQEREERLAVSEERMLQMQIMEDEERLHCLKRIETVRQ